MAFIPDEQTGMTAVIGVLLLVVTTVIIGATVVVFTLQIGEGISDPGPDAQMDIESNYFGDGVQYNDSVTITHRVGDRLRRDRLEVYIGDDLVYNETDNSESNIGEDGEKVPGLILEVDDDNFNDLNKPCRFKPKDCTSSDPPGDSDGADPSVVFEWEETVNAGQRLTIQERNAPNDSYDVIDPGDTVKVIYRGDGYTELIAEKTVAQE
ncbi:type IV pilin [Halorhabdus salina]|uniref:type IV pilin n=1 Tax=Halorhabdus salina TaxID=2750670 RepID=UPI0015EE45D4|nr:type IV pilin N-terminal domain-containing protein [Halorhabdus salina]